MSYYNAKMHQILTGAHNAPPDPLAGFKWSYFWGKGGKRKGEGEGTEEGKGGGRKGGEGCVMAFWTKSLRNYKQNNTILTPLQGLH